MKTIDIITIDGESRELKTLERVRELIKDIERHYIDESENGYDILPKFPYSLTDKLSDVIKEFMGDNYDKIKKAEINFIIDTLVSTMTDMMKKYTIEHDYHWNTENGKRPYDEFKNNALFKDKHTKPTFINF